MTHSLVRGKADRGDDNPPRSAAWRIAASPTYKLWTAAFRKRRVRAAAGFGGYVDLWYWDQLAQASPLGETEAEEGRMKTVLIYVDTSKEVGRPPEGVR
jgi:hypothetical protein